MSVCRNGEHMAIATHMIISTTCKYGPWFIHCQMPNPRGVAGERFYAISAFIGKKNKQKREAFVSKYINHAVSAVRSEWNGSQPIICGTCLCSEGCTNPVATSHILIVVSREHVSRKSPTWQDCGVS